MPGILYLLATIALVLYIAMNHVYARKDQPVPLVITIILILIVVFLWFVPIVKMG